MNSDQYTIIIILIFTFTMFIHGKWRHDVVAITSLFILIISDKFLGGEESNLISNYNQIFIGFSHPAVITVATVLIISRALRNSGVVDYIARNIKPYTKTQIIHLSSLSSVIAILSAFMNNVGALALMLPVTLKTSWENNRSPKVILMPVAFASILGGMMTMIGTPPNIIIANIRKEQQDLIINLAKINSESIYSKYISMQNISLENFQSTPFGLFDFTPVGAIITIIGITFISLIGWKFIPKDLGGNSNTGSIFSIDDYVTEIRIPEDCKFIGKNTSDINKITGDKITLIRIINNEGVAEQLYPNYIINKDDQFLIMADPNELKSAMNEYNLKLTKEVRFRIDALKKFDTTFMEVVVSPESSLLNQTREYFRKKTSNCLTLISVARNNNPITKRLGNIKFNIGDVLLLQGKRSDLKNNIKSLDLFPLEKRDIDIGIFSKIGFSLIVFIFAITLSMLGIFPASISFIGVILVFIFSGILPITDLYKSIDW